MVYDFVLAPGTGFEPVTNWLTANCSTTELPGIVIRAKGIYLFSRYLANLFVFEIVKAMKKILLLGSGELGKELVISLQRLG